jgi:hypothetical protein
MDKEKQAAKEAEERQQKVIDNLKQSTANYKKASAEQKASRKETDKLLDEAIQQAPSIHKQKIANVVYQVRKLQKELEDGGNQEEIIKKLNELR